MINIGIKSYALEKWVIIIKEKLISYPNKIHEILEYYKEQTGRSINSIINEAIVRLLIHEKLITFKRTTVLTDKEGKLIDD